MILYNLRCGEGHEFEVWFRDSALCERQLGAGSFHCPDCGSAKVEKAIMAPRLAGNRKGRPQPAPETRPSPPSSALPTSASASPAPSGENKAVVARKALLELRRQIEENCDYVGPAFAEEARKIHYGEVEERPIYGETSDDDAEALREEGVEIRQIPWLPRGDS